MCSQSSEHAESSHPRLCLPLLPRQEMTFGQLRRLHISKIKLRVPPASLPHARTPLLHLLPAASAAPGSEPTWGTGSRPSAWMSLRRTLGRVVLNAFFLLEAKSSFPKYTAANLPWPRAWEQETIAKLRQPLELGMLLRAISPRGTLCQRLRSQQPCLRCMAKARFFGIWFAAL